MSKIGRNFTLRLILSFTICASLWCVPGVSLLSEASHGQGQSAGRDGRPRPRKPEGTLPDLEEVKKESKVEREAPPPIPSTMRSPKLSEKPWDGRRVGDPETTSRRLDQAVVIDKKIRRAHARKSLSPAPPAMSMYEDTFIQNVFNMALLRGTNYDETLFWNYQLRAAYNQGQTSLKLAAVELGKTVFESASYAARNRDAHWYVYDLYKAYLMRDPDASGWAYWEAQVGPNGRENVRRGFEESGEFATLLSTIVLSGSAGSNPASLITARMEPRNQPGNGMLARDANWSVSLLSLPGRNGLDLGLALSYSSMVWTPSGPYFHFDEDNGFPSPGFRLGFPTVQRKVFDAQTARNSFLLLTPAGSRVELRQVGTSNIYEAGDSSYLHLTDNTPNLLVRSKDGTQLSFVEINNEFRCTQVKDRNGNYITINNNALGRITSITDTLGRVITFNYDSNSNLISITQAWNGQPSHQWVSFGWSTRNMQYGFATEKVIGTAAGAVIPVITQVALNDTSYFTFDYTNALQVSVMRNYFGGTERNATSFTYETPSGDVARLLSSSVSAQNWTGVNGVPAQVTTQYSVAGDGACVMTAPDGTIYKQYYGTGWQKGLTTLSEIWSGGVKQKWTTTAWAQDNTSVSYETNPRVTETNIYDSSGNRRRTVIDWGGNPQYVQYGLPYGVREYGADGVTEIKQTWTDYDLSPAYLERRIIGLVSHVHLSNVSSWQGKISYGYDDPARLSALPASATQHDSTYNTSFTARGNVTSVSQWDFTDINNASKKLTSYTNYFVTGSPASATDPSTHTSTISYTDAFSDNVNRNTFAYPTTLTDADSNSSTVQYNFDFGATTRRQSPAPADQAQGTIQAMAYNNLGQLERVTTVNNGAYKRFWYGPNYVASYATVNNVADELYAIQVADGLGRVIGATTNHPGSYGGYSLVSTIYDQMGRVWQQSNPTEINSSWIVTGDDAAGIYYTQQTYDWKGRPLVTTNPDSTTKTASYSGCGCAGGEVVTLTDEGTVNGGAAKRRQQKIYSDVLGRTIKTEILNWDGTGPSGTGPNNTVYSTTVNTYNARDQVTQVREYAGPEGSGTYQDTTMSYDGYGRLQARHLPEQNLGSSTSWTYNSDGTINTITDARGAVCTYGYVGNNRGLVKTITHTLTGSPPISVSYNYDAAGNRTAMTDPSGSVAYTYDQLSRLTVEARSFTGVGSYSINYAYNLAGALTSITDPFGASFTYQRDAAGRLKTVTGSPYAGFTNYVTDVGYRAWGAPKSVSYSDRNSTISYNGRMQPDQFRLTANGTGASIIRENYAYSGDGRLATLTDLDDTSGANPPATLRYLSRGYSYDQVGRVTSGYGTGGGGQGVPYNQSYSYDEFGNMKGRSAIYYSYNNNPFGSDTATYTNNRRNNWSYNPEGQVTASPSSSTDNARSMSYDAAGRLITSFESGSNVTYSAAYDGDGQLVKETSTTSTTSETSYIVRSTALRGEVLTRLDQSGNKKVTHVPAEGLLFATQRVIPGYGADVLTTYRNPLGTTETNKAVYDPLGNYIPYQAWHDPRPPAGSYNSGSMAQLSSSQANPESMAVGCIMDGLPTNCSRVMGAIGNGQADKVSIYGFAFSAWMMQLQASFLQVTTTHKVPRRLPPTGIYGDQDGKFYIAHGLPPKNVIEVSTAYVIAPGMQLSFTQTPQNPAPNVDDLQSRIAKMVSNPDCAKFISNLINGTATTKNPAEFTDALKGFEKIKGQGGFIYGDTIEKYYGFRGGTVHGTVSGGNAQVELPFPIPFRSFGPVNQRAAAGYAEAQAGINAMTALHEILHLAGKNQFSDYDYANTVAAMRGVTPPTFANVRRASEYWTGALEAACKPR